MRWRGQERNRALLVNYPAGESKPGGGGADQTQAQQDFRAELERVTNSTTLRASDNLKRLLSYLGEKWLTGETEGLKEYTIGVEAFGKRSAYDPQSDPAVRVLASKLRHKLEEYYLKDGADSPFRLSMPKGHYALEFKTVTVEGPQAAAAVLESAVARWRWVAVGIAALALLSWALIFYKGLDPGGPETAAVRPWSPELQLIWGPFIGPDRSTVIALGTPLFAKFDWGFARDPKMNDDDRLLESTALQSLSRQLGSTYAVPVHPYTGTGEAMGAFLLAKLLYGHVPGLEMQKSTTLTWEDIQHHNMIFVGPPKLNRMLKELPMEGGFVLTQGAIRNPSPRPGELEVYQDSWSPDHTELLEDYALITRMRGLHGNGEIMRLGGSSTEATWAAVEYVTQPAHAKDLVSRVGASNGAMPDKYQVVIRVKFRKLVPFDISYVTHRIL